MSEEARIEEAYHAFVESFQLPQPPRLIIPIPREDGESIMGDTPPRQTVHPNALEPNFLSNSIERTQEVALDETGSLKPSDFLEWLNLQGNDPDPEKVAPYLGSPTAMEALAQHLFSFATPTGSLNYEEQLAASFLFQTLTAQNKSAAPAIAFLKHYSFSNDTLIRVYSQVLLQSGSVQILALLRESQIATDIVSGLTNAVESFGDAGLCEYLHVTPLSRPALVQTPPRSTTSTMPAVSNLDPPEEGLSESLVDGMFNVN